MNEKRSMVYYNHIQKLNGQSFEDYLKTGRKDRYKLICAVDEYRKEHEPMIDDVISGSGRYLTRRHIMYMHIMI